MVDAWVGACMLHFVLRKYFLIYNIDTSTNLFSNHACMHIAFMQP